MDPITLTAACIKYNKDRSSRLSSLVAHQVVFRRLMKRNFDAYILCLTFGQKVPKLNSRPVYCSRLYGNYTANPNPVGLTGNSL